MKSCRCPLFPLSLLGQEGDYDELLTSSSISTLLDVQGFGELEKNLSSTPVMGSPSRDPFNTSAPEEVCILSVFPPVEEAVSWKVRVLWTA